MLNENAKAWVAALRSGKYEQTEGILTQISADGSVSHCCLGVACELAKNAGLSMVVYDNEDEWYTTKRSYDGQLSVLPSTVKVWLGLNDESGCADEPMQRYTSLAELNDSGCFSFGHIAEIIESDPKGLFHD
jgi:hypothetical protein